VKAACWLTAGEETAGAGGAGGAGGVVARATPEPLPWSGVVEDPEMPEIIVMPFVEIRVLASTLDYGTNSPHLRKNSLIVGAGGFSPAPGRRKLLF
jgi:hypothetical protein